MAITKNNADALIVETNNACASLNISDIMELTNNLQTEVSELRSVWNTEIAETIINNLESKVEEIINKDLMSEVDNIKNTKVTYETDYRDGKVGS